MLIDDGLLRFEEGSWRSVEDLAHVTVPPTIHLLLAARLDRLDADERAVIERGAVEGKVFHAGAVTTLSPESVRPNVRSRLLALARKELIRPDRAEFAGEDAFRFRHLLIRDAAYQAMPKEQRADLHERFAAWLGAAAAERIAEYEEILGYHLEQAYRYRTELGVADDRAKAARRRCGRAPLRVRGAGRRARGSERGEGAPRAERRPLGWRRAAEVARPAVRAPRRARGVSGSARRRDPRDGARGGARGSSVGGPGGAPADHRPGPGRSGQDDGDLSRGGDGGPRGGGTPRRRGAARPGDARVGALLLLPGEDRRDREDPRRPDGPGADDVPAGAAADRRALRHLRVLRLAPARRRVRRARPRLHPPGRQPHRRGPGSAGPGGAARDGRPLRGGARGGRPIGGGVRGARDPEFGDRHESGHRRDAAAGGTLRRGGGGLPGDARGLRVDGRDRLQLHDLRSDRADAVRRRDVTTRQTRSPRRVERSPRRTTSPRRASGGWRGRGCSPRPARSRRRSGWRTRRSRSSRAPTTSSTRATATRSGVRSSRRRAAATTRARRSTKRSPGTNGRGTSSPRPASAPRSRASRATEHRRIRRSRLLGSRRCRTPNEGEAWPREDDGHDRCRVPRRSDTDHREPPHSGIGSHDHRRSGCRFLRALGSAEGEQGSRHSLAGPQRHRDHLHPLQRARPPNGASGERVRRCGSTRRPPAGARSGSTSSGLRTTRGARPRSVGTTSPVRPDPPSPTSRGPRRTATEPSR